MSTPDYDSQNPYQAPASGNSPLAEPLTANNLLQLKLLKDFRSQIHALGGFWIFIGLVACGLGLFFALIREEGAEPGEALVASVILLTMGLLQLVLGVCTCLKQMWAVYVGLVLSYLSLAANLLRLNMCGLAIAGAVIFQAHRVIGWARDLKAQRIPLTARPEELHIKFTPPPGPLQWPTD